MLLTVREKEFRDIEKIVDYFDSADAEYLKGMGADKSKLPNRQEWINKLESEFDKSYEDKEYYYIIWLLDNEPVGHSNINKIEFGNTATMHLHLWKNDRRKKGLGIAFLRKTIPYYFTHFKLKTLVCEPYAENIAPNKVLTKLGFEFIRTYETTPGWINFLQKVSRYELASDDLEIIKMGI